MKSIDRVLSLLLSMIFSCMTSVVLLAITAYFVYLHEWKGTVVEGILVGILIVSGVISGVLIRARGVTYGVCICIISSFLYIVLYYMVSVLLNHVLYGQSVKETALSFLCVLGGNLFGYALLKKNQN
ncbi:MAG: hypothetical protein ACI4CT_05800 [Lachnospiraceae bacterium]